MHAGTISIGIRPRVLGIVLLVMACVAAAVGLESASAVIAGITYTGGT